MTDRDETEADKPDDKPDVTLPGTVEKIIKPISPDSPEKAQIAVEGAEELYKEIRIVVTRSSYKTWVE